MTAASPPKAPPPPISKAPPAKSLPPANGADKKSFAVASVLKPTAHRVVTFGTGGIGKSSLAMLAPGRKRFIDLDDSLPKLNIPEGVDRVEGIETWHDLRSALHDKELWTGVDWVIIDTATKAEELCVAHVLATVPHPDKGTRLERIEDYGYGKGYRYNYDAFLCLLGDLDQHIRAGRNVHLICHEQATKCPNPVGEDWLRYEPRLQNSDKCSIRHRVREWADHLLFVGYDISVDKGKGHGCGTRTIYPVELPHCMAKSRTIRDAIAYVEGDSTIWSLMFRKVQENAAA